MGEQQYYYPYGYENEDEDEEDIEYDEDDMIQWYEGNQLVNPVWG